MLFSGGLRKGNSLCPFPSLFIIGGSEPAEAVTEFLYAELSFAQNFVPKLFGEHNAKLHNEELPVIGSCVMRKGFWDRQGANIASRWKKMYSVSYFNVHKNDFGGTSALFRHYFIRNGFGQC